MKRYIRAFAYSKNDVRNKLEQGVGQLILHLIKLRLMPGSKDIDHWRKDVAEN